MGFCTEDQYRRFLKKVVTYEQNFLEDAGRTILLKLYFSVTKEEQKKRFERRKNDTLRQWKLSEVDLQAQNLWDEFTEKKFMLLKKTHTKQSPWWIGLPEAMRAYVASRKMSPGVSSEAFISAVITSYSIHYTKLYEGGSASDR